ncbi:MAG: hypothetical protein KF862_08340 [Chitinophagaceae bacterium]|nr:hypothetical protein [Chitinophagaceae bacterium]
MIKSNYINDILNLLLDSDEDGLCARQQISFLTEKNFDYTGSGLFVYFDHNIGIEKFRAEKPDLVLGGITIKSDKQHIEAKATLFFKDGLIDNLEIWCYDGYYPKGNLTNYVLTRTWINSDNKTIAKNNNKI